MGQWHHYRNILCVRPDNLGDVLMTSPAMRALKSSIPGCTITLLTSTPGTAAARHIPEVDEVITVDVPWVKTTAMKGSKQLQELIRELRQRSFDAAVLFTVYSQNPLPAAMVCYMADIPQVLGYCRENPYQLINNWLPDPEPMEYVRHEVERQLELVATVGAATENKRLSFDVPDSAMRPIEELLEKEGVDRSCAWFVMHTGVSEEKRRYPAAGFVEAAKKLSAQLGVRIVLTGSVDEYDYVHHIQEAIGPAALNLAGKLSLAELGALIQKAPLLVSNNTGPVHIAAAVGTPVVVTYAKTNPQHTPWQVPNKVLYFEVPEHLRSRNQLLQSFPGIDTPKASPEAIAAAAKELLVKGK